MTVITQLQIWLAFLMVLIPVAVIYIVFKMQVHLLQGLENKNITVSMHRKVSIHRKLSIIKQWYLHLEIPEYTKTLDTLVFTRMHLTYFLQCFSFGHMTYQNTRILLKYQNTCEKYRNTCERHLLKKLLLALIEKRIYLEDNLEKPRGQSSSCKQRRLIRRLIWVFTGHTGFFVL